MCTESETTVSAVVGVRDTNIQGFLYLKNYDIMSTNTFSKETEIRLANFFNTSITPCEMAKALRQANYVLALGSIRQDETPQQEIIKLENSFYWLNELAEVLNPYLDVE